MTPVRFLLRDTIDCARRGDWAAYRARLATLREALDSAAAQDETVLRHLEVLGAAAPEHDAEGCIAQLEALGEALGAEALAASAAAPASAPPIDLRGLQPPEPMVRIFDALRRAPDAPLRVILPHEPLPLYNLLRERGFRYSGAARGDGGFELLIEANK